MKEFKEEDLNRFKNLDINIKQGFPIAKGGYGQIFPFNFFWNRKGQKPKFRKAFVLKKFDDEEYRNNSLFIWEYLHKNKFKTFSTYRKFEKTSIIMSSLSNEEKFCISVINDSKKNEDYNYLEQNKIHKIINYEKFVKDFFDICEKLWEYNIYFGEDLFFITGNKNNETEFETILGDFDTVKIGFTPDIMIKWLNIQSYRDYFFIFLKRILNCSTEELGNYIRIFNEECKKRIEKIDPHMKNSFFR